MARSEMAVCEQDKGKLHKDWGIREKIWSQEKENWIDSGMKLAGGKKETLGELWRTMIMRFHLDCCRFNRPLITVRRFSSLSISIRRLPFKMTVGVCLTPMRSPHAMPCSKVW